MIKNRFSRLMAAASAAAAVALLVAIPTATARASSQPSTPSISGFSPATGWTTGRDTVTVNGSGLANTTAAQFVPSSLGCGAGLKSVAANIVSVSDTTVVLATNPAAPGCYAISLTTSTRLGSSSNVSQSSATSSALFIYSTDVDPTDQCVNIAGTPSRTSTEFSTTFSGGGDTSTPLLCKSATYTVDIRSGNGSPLDWVIDPAHTTYTANVTVQSVSATEVVVSLTGVQDNKPWTAAGAVNPNSDVQFFVTASNPAQQGSGQQDRAPELASGASVFDAGTAASASSGGSMN